VVFSTFLQGCDDGKVVSVLLLDQLGVVHSENRDFRYEGSDLSGRPWEHRL
jgi:hypothetical protein